MQEEFHGVVKLITGEEIFGLVSIDENDGDPVIMLQSPVIMKVFNNPTGQYVKIKPWLEIPEEDIFLIKYDKIITMTEIKNQQMIQFYDRYLSDDDFDFEIDGRVNLSNHMGLLSTVEDARKKLEEIFKIPSNNKEI
jgi:hypothetical protein|tara:strand:+ start:60 stop:470 length:411 start_codon:yes stop_codon:yes gene_type:complete